MKGHPLRRGSGFTIVELLVALGIIGVLAAIGMSVFGPGRAGASRSMCDTRVKALAIALDAFRQERGRYPRALSELVSDKYISDAQLMRCPDDPDPASAGYSDYYVLRGAHNDPRYPNLPTVAQLPVIVCPFHEQSGVGVQAFAGLQTHQFATRSATVVSANAASVKRPGKDVQPARSGMLLHGGDLIETGANGAALIQFFDGSRCELSGNSKVSVLQSFLQNGDGDLYTLVRQYLGDVAYSVHHGSKFDVSTPTATAGALGTEFHIFVTGRPGQPDYAEWWINSSPNSDSQVYCSSPKRATIIARHLWVNVGAAILNGAIGSITGTTGGGSGGDDSGNGNNGNGNNGNGNGNGNNGNGNGNNGNGNNGGGNGNGNNGNGNGNGGSNNDDDDDD